MRKENALKLRSVPILHSKPNGLSTLLFICSMVMNIGTSIAVGEGRSLNRPNVLLIIVDDLRPDLACYGQNRVHSPNIDRLASRGVVFDRAYCQIALCNPSRASLLTGLRPDTTGIVGNGGHVRDRLPETITLPQLFRNNGYRVQGIGKIFHPGLDDPVSWSEPHWDPQHSSIENRGQLLLEEMKAYYGPIGRSSVQRQADTALASGKSLETLSRRNLLGPAWEIADSNDRDLIDGQVAERAIQALRESSDRPFFLAVGFLKPHLPFSAPKKYWDLYPLDAIELVSHQPPRDVPLCALHESSELRGFLGMPKTGPIGASDAKQLIRGYRAATSYVDAQVGRLLDELDRLNLRKNTAVCFLGDHGYQLGEHTLWCKHSNFEWSARVPLIVSPPHAGSGGSRSHAIVEIVDCYPTLAELAGLSIPPGLEGTSFVPLLERPDRAWKSAAFTQWHKPGKEGIVGRSIRTDRWRYTRWTNADGQRMGVELYDHVLDPNEDANIAGQPSKRAVVTALEGRLNAAWAEARPMPQ